jgi:F420-0:gamma-glutamyl ligase-like protein
MTLLLTSVNWVGVLCFLLITAAAVVVWGYLLRGVFGVVRDFFRGVRKHGR